MQNLKRNINMGFRVTAKEQELIRKRMAQTNIKNLRAYLLKMAVDGRVISLELDSLTECSKLLRNISNNINQIAVHANTYGAVYDADMVTIKNRLDDVWQQQEQVIKTISELVEVV